MSETKTTREETEGALLPKIFVFCNGCAARDWHNFVAISEDGEYLAGHVCSHHGYAAHDMGVHENGWNRDIYAKRYPNGFEVVYCEVTSRADLDKYPDLLDAFAKQDARAAAEGQA